MILNNKTVIITGGSEGVGAATARPFAEAGANCWSQMPPLREIENGHKIACHRVSDDGVAPQDKMVI